MGWSSLLGQGESIDDEVELGSTQGQLLEFDALYERWTAQEFSFKNVENRKNFVKKSCR